MAGVILLAFLLEVAVRVKDAIDGFGFFSSHRDITRKMKQVIPFRTFGHNLYREINGEQYIVSTHDELYPLKKEVGTFRVVTFGGSTTKNFIEGVHYPFLLEQELQEYYPQKKIEVINVAENGYATPHSLILFELNALSWDPDLVIVMDNINDLQAAYFPRLTFDYSNKYGDQFFLPDYRSRFTLPNVLFRWSQAYWIIRERIILALDKIDAQSRSSKERYKRTSYGKEPPILSQEIFKRNLETFITLAKSHEIAVILATQALEPSEEYWDRAIRYKTYNDRVTYPLHEEFVAHLGVFNDIIRTVAKERNVYAVDNSASLAGDRQFFADYVHYTKKGVEKLADNFAQLIIANNLIK